MHQPSIADLNSRHRTAFPPDHQQSQIALDGALSIFSAPLSSIITSVGPHWDRSGNVAGDGSARSSPPLSPTTSLSAHSLRAQPASALTGASVDGNKQQQLAARDDQQSEFSSNIATASTSHNNRPLPPLASDLIRFRNAPERNPHSSCYQPRPSHSTLHNSCAKLEASPERPPPSPPPHRVAIEFARQGKPPYGDEVLLEHCIGQLADNAKVGTGNLLKLAPKENADRHQWPQHGQFVVNRSDKAIHRQVAAAAANQKGKQYAKPVAEPWQSTAVNVGWLSAETAAGGTLAHNQQLEQSLQRRQRQQQQQQAEDQRSRVDFAEKEEKKKQTNKSSENCRAKRTSKDGGSSSEIGNERGKTIQNGDRGHNYHGAISDWQKGTGEDCTGHFASAAAGTTPLEAVAVDDYGLHHGDPIMGRVEECTASPTFAANGTNKPCTYQTRLQLTSDTETELSADTRFNPSGLRQWPLRLASHRQPRARLASSASSPCIETAHHRYRLRQYRSPGGDRVHRQSAFSSTSSRAPEQFTKTATPSVLRAKLFSHSASHQESDSLEEATERLLPTEPSSSGDHATECPGTPTSKHSATGGLVSWNELRNKLIKLQRKANQRRKNKRNWTLSLPTSQASSASTSGRLVINRNLLQEFRSRFRRSSNPSSLFYFDNPVSESNTSAVNYSYSYYNFFYYPSRDQKCGSSVEGPARLNNTEAPTNEPSHQQLDTGRELTFANRTADSCSVRSGRENECNLHQYHRLHHHPTSSLTSLLSLTSPSASSSAAASPFDCCKHHFQCAGIEPERNQLLPHSSSADHVNTQHSQYLSRFDFGYRHHHHHHHNHRSHSLCTSLLDSDAKVDASTPTIASGPFHHHNPAIEIASPNTCLSTIMEILPLLLLLTMGVIISTTCAKYTFHSPSLPANSPSISASAAFHHRYNGQFEAEEKSSSPSGSDTSATSSGADNRPEPPYLMMMQNDDEYTASQTRSEPDSSVESFDSSSAVDESMKKSASPRSFMSQQKHQHGHPSQSHQAGTAGHHHQQQLLAQLAHQYSAMQLHWLSNTSVTCNDGTRAGFYVRHSPSSRRWLIYLEGGWYCMSKNTCDQRWSKMREFMTSFRWTQYKTFNGILSSSPAVNPYWWDANHVFVPYCSSDIWSGNSAAARGEMAFLGSRIIDEVIKELIHSPVYRFNDAKFVLMAGSSAGAAGVMINLDRVARTIAESGSKADVRGLADSGWVLESDYLDNVASGKQHKLHHAKPHSPPCTDAVNCSPMDSIRGAFKLWNSRVPELCVERFPSEPWRCFYGYRLYPTLQTPLFIVQYQYDEFQIHVDGITRGSRGWNDHERMQYIRLLSEAIRSTLSNATAVFAPACMSHIVLTKPDWHKVSVKGVTLPEALHCWEETPMANSLTRVRFDPLSFFQQYPSLYQPYNQMHHKMATQFDVPANSKNVNGYYNSPGYYQTPGQMGSSSQKMFSMYPYGMPVMTSGSGSNGNGASNGDISVDVESGDEDELSQYYSNGRPIPFNYANTAAAASSALKKSPVVGGNNNNYFNNMPDEMMANDDPGAITSDSGKSLERSKSSFSPTTSADHSKTSSTFDGINSASSGDENSIVIVNGTSVSAVHRSASAPAQQTNNSGHAHHSNQRKQDKKRKKRKRRKHMQRRFQTSTSTTSAPLTNSVINKPKQTSQLEDNAIKLAQPMYQNDGAPALQSRSKKHRPNRMSSPFDFGGSQSFGDHWSISGGDDGVSSSTDAFQGKCHFRLVDDHKFPKTNALGCPSFHD